MLLNKGTFFVHIVIGKYLKRHSFLASLNKTRKRLKTTCKLGGKSEMGKMEIFPGCSSKHPSHSCWVSAPSVHAGGLDIRWHSLAGATFKGSIGQSTQEQRLQKLSHDVGRGQGDSQKRALYANVGKDESWWRSGRRGECLEEGGGLEYRVALSHAPSSPLSLS